MQLRDYLTLSGLTQTAFASKAGLQATTIHGLLTGRRSPSLAVMLKIKDATEGAVQPNDWAKQPEAAV